MRNFIFCLALSIPALAQTVQPVQQPDLDAQRAAMKKLEFLVGKWSGEARIFAKPGEPTVLLQTEEARYRLDGLVLEIEGVGRNKAHGKFALQALGILTYDDLTKTYHMRAFNDGRFLETEVKLADEGKGMTWGFAVGPVKTSSTLKMNERGEWTEQMDLIIGSAPPRKYVEITVRK
jgi:hypothetical protein